MSTNVIFYIIVLCIFLLILLNTVLGVIFKTDKDKLTRQRLDTLRTKATLEDEREQNRELIKKLTGPLVKLVPNEGNDIKNLSTIERKLHYVGWDDIMSPVQWYVIVTFFRALAILLFILLGSQSLVFGLIIGLIIFIAPTFLLNNSYSNKQEKVMQAFPDMISILSGYLSTDMSFQDAVRRALPSMSDEWREMMEKFLIKSDSDGTANALEWLKNEANVLPIKEFVSIINLTLELGGSVKDGFDQQQAKIQQMLDDIVDKKIERRQMFATIVQAPLFLCIIVTFALPTVGSLLDIGLF